MKNFYILFLVLFSISINAQTNLLTNGTVDDQTGWTFLNMWGTDNTVDVEGTPTPPEQVLLNANNGTVELSMRCGSNHHVGFYTSVTLTAGRYQFDCEITLSDYDNGWGEFYWGSVEPQNNNEYNGDGRLFTFLGDEVKPSYSGKMSESGRVTGEGETGIFEAPADGTYYFLYRTGGSCFGDHVFDNFTLFELASSPSPSFTSSVSGSTVSFTNTSSSADSYSWDFGDGNTSTEESPTHTYATDGDYYVKLTATSNSANESVSTVDWITIGTSANMLTNTAWNDGTGWTTFNTDSDGNTRASVSFGNGEVSFIKSPDGGEWSGYGIYQEVNLDAGSYQFDIKGKYADISDVWFEAHVGSTEPTDLADYGNDDSKLLKIAHGWGSVKSADDYATNIGADPNWATTENNTTLTPDNGFFTISTSGTYYLVIKAGGGTYGSITTDNDNGIMSASNPILIPSSNTLDVKEIVIPSFGFYPNPASKQLTFVGNVEGEVVQVFDVLGREHLNEVIVKNKLAVDKLDSGLYFLKIKSQVQRLIIK
jgi:PKD repeat protein